MMDKCICGGVVYFLDSECNNCGRKLDFRREIDADRKDQKEKILDSKQKRLFE